MWKHKQLVLPLLLLAGLGAQAQSAPRAVPEAAQLCVNCHVQTAEQMKTVDAQMVPMLGGQHADYLAVAIKAYSRRQRDHLFMRGIASGLDARQLADVVAYFASAPVAVAGSPAAHRPKPAQAARCVACHGDSRNKPASTDTPVLAGQHALYLSRAFEAYANGSRSHAVMRAQAANDAGQMSLAPEELSAVTRWFSTLPNGVTGQ